MGSAFHQLCQRYSGTLTPTAPTANGLWETFTFTVDKLRTWSRARIIRKILNIYFYLFLPAVFLDNYYEYLFKKGSCQLLAKVCARNTG